MRSSAWIVVAVAVCMSSELVCAQGVVVVEHQEHTQQPATQPAPAPVYGQPPGYAQPAYQPGYVQPHAHRPRRYRVRYQEGMQLPPDARTYKRVSLGMLIPGAVLFALPYLSTAFTYMTLKDTRSSTRQPQNLLLVPLLGPFLAMPRLDENFGGDEIGPRRGLLLADGLMQLAGATLLIVGAIPRTYAEYYVGNQPGVRVGPSFAGGPGLELHARW